MTLETFAEAVHRIGALEDSPILFLCGLGEPLLHPNLVEMVSHSSNRGLPPSITTNAYLLTKELSRRLIDAGLTKLVPSVSGIDDTYRQIHRLDFQVVQKNIIDFISISKGKCDVQLSITLCDPIEDEIDKLKTYWKRMGIHEFTIYRTSNRGGALDMGYAFVNNEAFYQEAEAILAKNKIDSLCLVPYLFTFVGWDGNYYMCCHDYVKKLPLGNVFEHGIKEVDVIKLRCLENKPNLCKNCDASSTNRIREMLFRIQRGEATQSELDEEITRLKQTQETVDQVRGVWKESAVCDGHSERRAPSKMGWIRSIRKKASKSDDSFHAK